MRAIIAALRRCQEERRSCVIATIIQVEGSAYRREGARCLIHVNGEITGILSGGCLEEELRLQVCTVFADGVPKRVAYDLRAGEDEPWGLGQGCNGAVTIWLELFDPVLRPEAAAVMLADGEARLTSEIPYWALMVVSAETGGPYRPGDRLKISEEDRQLGNPLAAPDTVTGLRSVTIERHSLEVFTEHIRSEPRLYIIGVGADVELLSRLAGLMAWPATVVYHQTSRADEAMFPAAEQVLHVPRGDFSRLGERPGSYAVVMTHQLELDQEAVRQLLPMAHLAYVGVLGSRSRIQRIVTHAATASGFRAEWLHKLHAPIGLDIGGGTPETISLSIMSEMMAHRHGRLGGSLRDMGMLLSSAEDEARLVAGGEEPGEKVSREQRSGRILGWSPELSPVSQDGRATE
ncbi:XdhC family protein [Paenibacillus daejeonensis]|uniref:XdhC family protein n=1 Tax=Paenibacillus daejeonensis TaxID=135193 RepID=UPI00037B1427|nr:XdhC/CoxI family protein [Paenibacillus daejeonensis]